MLNRQYFIISLSCSFINLKLDFIYLLLELPNLETLIMSKRTFDSFKFVSQFKTFKIPKLETIFVGDLHLSVSWATFKLNNPNVKKIEINNYEDCDEIYYIESDEESANFDSH